MSWLTFAYAFFAVVIGFFAGYYFILSYMLRNQVIQLTRKLDSTYELMDFMDQLRSEESTDSEN